MPLMLLFQVHKKFLPVFLVWFILVRSYILFYISWDLCGYKNIQMLCRSACFKRWIYVCPVVCFFVLFTCSHHLLSSCQTVEGRHTVSHLLCRGGVLSLGKQVFFSAANLPPQPSLRVVCLVERLTMRYLTEWQIITRDRPTLPSLSSAFFSCCILVRFVLIRCLPSPSILPSSPNLPLLTSAVSLSE